MRKNRVIEQNRCYHFVSWLEHRAFFLDDKEKDRAVALMRRVEAGVQASMSYCINRAVSISSDPFGPFNVELTWNDIIDPNYSLFGDNVLAFIFKRYPGANPADYVIRIRWNHLFILREAYE